MLRQNHVHQLLFVPENSSRSEEDVILFVIFLAGFTPDVKLWSVEFTKTDDFKQVTVYYHVVENNNIINQSQYVSKVVNGK